MKIFLKAAHHWHYCYTSRTAARKSILCCAGQLKSETMARALKEVSKPSREICVLSYPKVSGKDQKVLKPCRVSSEVTRTFRRSHTLSVEPTTTIGTLKSFLKLHAWTPRRNLVLVQNKKMPLDDDNATLGECGIKDRDSLLVCMDDSFELKVLFVGFNKEVNRFTDKDVTPEVVIPISSCFETVGELKEKLHEKTGIHPKDQKIGYQCKIFSRGDENNEKPLVAFGIVNIYLQCHGGGVPIRMKSARAYQTLTMIQLYD